MSLGLVGSTDASAAAKHPSLGNFGSAAEPSFSAASGIAVDQPTGDVLVIDEADLTVSRWHADGTAADFSALGTNVIDGKDGADTTPQNGILGEFAGPREVQVAIDNSGGATDGDIYVTDSSHGVVDIFAADGHYLGQLTAAGSSSFGESCGVAVDQSGSVYVADFAGEVHKFVPSGAFPVNTDNTTNFAATEPCTLAAGAGPTAGYLFVASWGGPVTKFDAGTGAEKYVVDSGSSTTISVDPTTGHLYVATDEVVKEYDASGATSASLVATISATSNVRGVAIDESSGRVYLSRGGASHLEMFGPLVEGESPVATTGDVSGVGNTGATLEGAVDPNESATTWQFEYGLTTAYGSVAPATPADAGEGADAVPVSVTVSGLQPGTEYHYRLRAVNANGSSSGVDQTFVTTGPALVETTGSPVRTATTGQLEGRVLPTSAATTYHFEFGDQGPCDSNPCQSTPAKPAGSGNEYVFVSEEVSGLEPDTAYHYRLVADNGNVAGQAVGGDMTVTTRATDEPPAPAPHPGPPGSDRGWEQVNVPDTNGNPVTGAAAISDNGERVIYQANGGTPDTTTGTLTTQVLAERTASGWRNVDALPPRNELKGALWFPSSASGDLSNVVLVNLGNSGATSFRVDWPDESVQKLYEPADGTFGGYYEASADASRVIMRLDGSVDPDHPVSANPNLYDVSSGAPEMVSLLPGNTVPACGIAGPQPSVGALPENAPPRSVDWVSSDGNRVLFPSEGNVCNNRSELYLRDLTAESTKLVSGPAISGPDCRAEFAKMTEDAVFFWTRSRLAAADQAVAQCGEDRGGDIYRYDIGDESLDCLTCISPAIEANLPENERFANKKIAVAGDGSRVYFASPNRLLPGAATPGFYRLEVGTGNVRYIAPATGAEVGDAASQGEAISADGSVIVFRSNAAGINPLNGSDNGGTHQYYRYDDRDRSLVCVSCPQDGSSPVADAPLKLVASFEQAGPNLSPLDDEGDFAFVAPTPLVPADHNTASGGQEASAGYDAYEWRDGRLLLVTDGDTQWVGNEGVNIPIISGFTPSGRDLFFTVPKQLTFEAIDGFSRLYDARIGGGFSPPPLPPCPEPCEESAGSSSNAPTSVSPGTPAFSGPEDPKPHFRHRKHRRHKHHHRRHHRKKHHSKSHRPQLTESRRASR